MDLVGRQFGHYRVEERIGHGGTATVYKAYQPDLDRHVAIKIMHSHLNQSEGFAERFQQEARLMGKLHYPHIVRVLDAGTVDGLYYLVMDYTEGGTLQGILHGKHTLPIEQLLDLATQMADALTYMHQRALIHGDIKPANILFADRSYTHALLTDFGLARLLEQDAVELSAPHALVGTPNYMSPEAVRGEPSDVQSDIYSLGVVLYEMLAGRPPYMASTSYSMLMKHASQPLPPIRRFNPAVPPTVEKLLNKALAKEPADRFQSALAFGDALLNVRIMLMSAASTTSPPLAESTAHAVAATPKQPTTALSKMTPGLRPRPTLFVNRRGLTILGTLSVVFLLFWCTFIALLLLESSVGAIVAKPVVASSPIRLQTELAVHAKAPNEVATTSLADGDQSAVQPATVVEKPADATPGAPLNRLTPAAITLVSSIVTEAPAVTPGTEAVVTEPMVVSDKTAVATATPMANMITPVGIPVAITPLPQK